MSFPAGPEDSLQKIHTLINQNNFQMRWSVGRATPGWPLPWGVKVNQGGGRQGGERERGGRGKTNLDFYHEELGSSKEIGVPVPAIKSDPGLLRTSPTEASDPVSRYKKHQHKPSDNVIVSHCIKNQLITRVILCIRSRGKKHREDELSTGLEVKSHSHWKEPFQSLFGSI